jgi:hypothetical protein
MNDIQHVSLGYGRGRNQASTYVFLSQNKYADNRWIRVFPYIDEMEGSFIIYYFEEGLLGMKVMKDYRFQ